MTSREMRKITAKANRIAQREEDKRAKDVIRGLKADIKKAAKKGVSDFRCKIRNTETYNRARLYFISKGFRCWEYTMADCKYLAIEW